IGSASLAPPRLPTSFVAALVATEVNPASLDSFRSDYDQQEAAIAEGDIGGSELDAILPDIAGDIGSVWQRLAAGAGRV
ncbi:MAG: hypothetical protein NTY19_23690, partial [Planctomycetota bacterium]|nr:hypothetical protein [Planctomycetota bacterium]